MIEIGMEDNTELGKVGVKSWERWLGRGELAKEAGHGRQADKAGRCRSIGIPGGHVWLSTQEGGNAGCR